MFFDNLARHHSINDSPSCAREVERKGKTILVLEFIPFPVDPPPQEIWSYQELAFVYNLSMHDAHLLYCLKHIDNVLDVSDRRRDPPIDSLPYKCRS